MKKSCGKVVKRPDVTAPSTLNPISTRIDSQSSIILNPQSQAEGSSLGNNDATPQTTTLGSTGFQSQTSQNHDPHSHVKGSSVGKKGDVPSQSYANPISTALHSQTSQILNPHSQVKEANIQVNSTPQTSIPPKKRADANILVNSTEHISYPPKKMAKSTDTAQVDSDESVKKRIILSSSIAMSQFTLLANLDLSIKNPTVRVKVISKWRVNSPSRIHKNTILFCDEKSEPTTYCNYYAFKPFGSIIRGLAHPMYCIDLYGALVGVGSLETYVLQGDGVGDNSLDNKLVFSLINPEYVLQITLQLL
ncbi:unnamed protein product [Brassica napus]|uniref:(rape) hypothetical protein n=1 Tax=Brassica napus TaxID=3708 RepID=A0A816L9Q6_BRANA|nr:unnamed protein product [Brassica napus]